MIPTGSARQVRREWISRWIAFAQTQSCSPDSFFTMKRLKLYERRSNYLIPFQRNCQELYMIYRLESCMILRILSIDSRLAATDSFQQDKLALDPLLLFEYINQFRPIVDCQAVGIRHLCLLILFFRFTVIPNWKHTSS